MVEIVFNWAVPGLFAVAAVWFTVSWGLIVYWSAEQRKKEQEAVGRLAATMNGTPAMGGEQLVGKAKEHALALVAVPDKVTELMLCRAHTAGPLWAAFALIVVCVLVEMGITQKVFVAEPAREVCKWLCWAAVLFEVLTMVWLFKAASAHTNLDAMRRVGRPCG